MREQTALPHTNIYVGRLWNQVTQKGNFSKDKVTNDMIVLHSMAGSVAGSTAHFQNPNTIPSAQYGIGLDGSITQWLPEDVTAYHANNYSVNQRSIGIEHEDLGNNKMVRTDVLYETSAQLVADIAKFYGIPLDREHVKKHNEITSTECPGTLDIDRIINRAKQLLAVPPAPSAEPLHQYEMPESVFNGMVTEGSEYGEIWKALGLDPNFKTHPGSHKVILEYIAQKVAEARVTTPAGTQTQPVTTPTPSIQTPPKQSNSVWQKNLFQLLRDIRDAVKKPSAQ